MRHDSRSRKASRMMAADALTMADSMIWIASDARQDSFEMMLSSRPGLCLRKKG